LELATIILAKIHITCVGTKWCANSDDEAAVNGYTSYIIIIVGRPDSINTARA